MPVMFYSMKDSTKGMGCQGGTWGGGAVGRENAACKFCTAQILRPKKRRILCGIRRFPISKRKAVAPRLYSVSGKVKGQVVCLVDDYVVTSASMMAAATHLYKAGARKVVGAALAI